MYDKLMAKSIEEDQGEQTNQDFLEQNNASDKDDNRLHEQNERPRARKKNRLREDSTDTTAGKRGVCYLSRVPPRMNPLKLRQILSKYGDVQRIYLVAEDPTYQIRRKQAGGFRGKEFMEGWVEFTKKSVAKRVANILNGEQIGGKKRSFYYYDLWNIKYLSKFKWDDLTAELADKHRTREQKLALELSAAKRERDFYLSKVDISRALKSVKERKMKKQKTEELASQEGSSDGIEKPKVIRKFPQNKPVDQSALQSKPKLSQDFLSGVFRGS